MDCFWPKCSDSRRCAAHGSCVAKAQAGGAAWPKSKEAAGQVWPFDKPNGWDRDAARLLALIQMYPMMWLCLHRAKYIEMRIDTRDCGFNLYDRDRKPLKADDIVKAIDDLKARFEDDGTVASREYREGSRPEEPLLAEVARLRNALKEIERVGKWTGTDNLEYTSSECRLAQAALASSNGQSSLEPK